MIFDRNSFISVKLKCSRSIQILCVKGDSDSFILCPHCRWKFLPFIPLKNHFIGCFGNHFLNLICRFEIFSQHKISECILFSIFIEFLLYWKKKTVITVSRYWKFSRYCKIQQYSFKVLKFQGFKVPEQFQVSL